MSTSYLETCRELARRNCRFSRQSVELATADVKAFSNAQFSIVTGVGVDPLPVETAWTSVDSTMSLPDTDSLSEESPSKGSLGRRPVTFHLAFLAESLRKQKKTWLEVYQIVAEKFPDDDRAQNGQKVYDAHRRHFRNKNARKSKF